MPSRAGELIQMLLGIRELQLRQQQQEQSQQQFTQQHDLDLQVFETKKRELQHTMGVDSRRAAVAAGEYFQKMAQSMPDHAPILSRIASLAGAAGLPTEDATAIVEGTTPTAESLTVAGAQAGQRAASPELNKNINIDALSSLLARSSALDVTSRAGIMGNPVQLAQKQALDAGTGISATDQMRGAESQKDRALRETQGNRQLDIDMIKAGTDRDLANAQMAKLSGAQVDYDAVAGRVNDAATMLQRGGLTPELQTYLGNVIVTGSRLIGAPMPPGFEKMTKEQQQRVLQDMARRVGKTSSWESLGRGIGSGARGGLFGGYPQP